MAPAQRTKRRTAWLAVVGLTTMTILLLKGCAVTVIAPANVQDPVEVFLLDYGRHPALVLPRTETKLVEYSYGEWEWYALNRNSFSDVFRAWFIKSEGTLGRRSLYRPHTTTPWWDDVPAESLHTIIVERSLADGLLKSLDEQWEANRESAVYNQRHDLDMVRHSQRYNAFTNSNIILSRWLEELDCTVRGWPLLPMQWHIVNE